MRIDYALLVLVIASSMERDGNNRGGRGEHVVGDSSRQRRPFFAASPANVGNNTPDLKSHFEVVTGMRPVSPWVVVHRHMHLSRETRCEPNGSPS